MLYKKLTLELIVVAEEAEAFTSELDNALDRLDEKYMLFGGDIQMTTLKHPGTQRRSALAHTIAAGKAATSAITTARMGVAAALRAVI